MRLNKPVGTMNIFFPYLFGALFAGCVSRPVINPKWLLARSVSLFIAAFVLRSAGCTWNDIADRDLDRLVERTCSRPMARDAISLRAAYMFTAAQVGIWLAVFSQLLPELWIPYAAPLLFLVWLYPFAKRVTDYAQVVLGITLGWGVLVGAAVVGRDASASDTYVEWQGLASLYLVYVVWAVIHDTVYAHQDLRDDLTAGIRSMAVRFLRRTKALLWALAAVQIGLLGAVGLLMRSGMWYYLGAVGGNAVILYNMILRVKLSDPQDCLWWFQTGSLLVGGSIVAGLWGEYDARLKC